MENNNIDVQKSDEIFTKGLVALILAWLTGIVGLILAIINKKNIKNYLATGGELTGKGRTGKLLTNIAFGLGLANAIIIAIYIIIVIATTGGTIASYFWS